jgi:vancomycin resistance protein YoaR
MKNKSFWIVGSVSGLCGILVMAAIVLAAYAHFLNTQEFRFYPGVHVGAIDLSGLTYLEGVDAVAEHINTLTTDGVAVEYRAAEDARIAITPIVLPLESGDTEREMYAVDYETSADEAYAIGRTGSRFDQMRQQWWAWRYQREVQLHYRFNTEEVDSLLREAFSPYETPAANADIKITESGEVDVIDESIGETIDFAALTAQIEDHVRSLDNTPIQIMMQADLPTVSSGDIENDVALITGYLDAAPITLTWEERQWEFNREDLGSWLSYRSGSLRVDPQALDASLAEAHEVIDVAVQESRWVVDKNEGGALIGIHEMQTAVTGRTVDAGQTARDIFAALENHVTQPTLAVSVTKVEPKFTPETVSATGIHDLLGTGHSNMGGSPQNRRLNIARGVELLNGLLIAPDEDFSLLGALKPFTEENGYYPELVIKGDKTLPEVGGGLCQIGTTTFRAAMGSGLPILKRQNHSYAVSYYSDDRNRQPGTDATIYDPAPDFSFENDTDGYILLQTRIEGNDLYFDLWGVSDGRVGSFTPPVTSNWIQPPPLKEIPTTDLAPGQRKCTESAHAGVTADFTYTVAFPDGSTKEQAFHSVYKPWQAVCLVGVDPNAEEVEEESEEAETASE